MVDTSPLGATAEPLELVPIADVIVIVARVGQTNIETAQRTIAILRDLTTTPILLVLTGLSGERAAYYENTDRNDKRNAKANRRRLRRRGNADSDEGLPSNLVAAASPGRRATDPADPTDPLVVAETDDDLDGTSPSDPLMAAKKSE